MSLEQHFAFIFQQHVNVLRTQPMAGKLNDLHGNGERLLIVDDDEQQQIICSQILKSLGYKVNVVASGEDALEYLKTNTVDLLILDMILGQGMNGRQTYAGVKKTLPDLKAIIVSGFSADAEVKEAQRLGAGRFVKKPYTISQIGTAIKETLVHVRSRFARLKCLDVFHGLIDNPLSRLSAGPGDMGSDDQVGEFCLKEWIGISGRFDTQDIDCRTGDFFCLQGFYQCLFIDKAAAGTVDQKWTSVSSG